MAGFSYTTGNSDNHAVLWNGATAVDLNSFLDGSAVSAGWVLHIASGINDQGAVIGYASNTNTDLTYGFVLTPVPEPETYTMLLVGLGLIGVVSRRRSTKPSSTLRFR